MKIKKDDVKPGKAKSCLLGEEKIIICNVNGEYFATSNVCSHADFDIVVGESDLVDFCQVICSKHGARFDVKTGKATCMPAVAPISTFKVNIVGDEIEVEAV